MDTFNEAGLSPDEIKMLTLQFMGQHLTGDLKVLDQNIISRNNTLQGMVLNPTAVINSIPSSASQPLPQPQVPVLSQQVQVTPTLGAETFTSPQPILAPVEQSNNTNRDQLEFSFETSPLSVRIFESLERIEKKLSLIEDRLFALEDFKKKD